MRFLDLDLDFFLSANAYGTECDGGRLDSAYKPWSACRVRHFLEQRCGLSPENPVQGRTVKYHNGVFDFWHTLIKSGRLKTPFEVTHVDAHPDLWVGSGLHLRSNVLSFDSELMAPTLKTTRVHPGNYLTLAIASGWIAALIWVPLTGHTKGLPKWDADARSYLKYFKNSEKNGSDRVAQVSPCVDVGFEVVPRSKFRTIEKFDFMAVSKSPDFTPRESDKLVAVIEEYIKKI